jgi:hypothetical protein
VEDSLLACFLILFANYHYLLHHLNLHLLQFRDLHHQLHLQQMLLLKKSKGSQNTLWYKELQFDLLHQTPL